MILLHHIQIIESFFGIFLFTIANPGVSQLPLHKEGTRLAPNQHTAAPGVAKGGGSRGKKKKNFLK